MRNKKAMSEIVTTVIMVVLALVAVAVIWQIINNLIGEKGAQISVTQKCLDVKLNVQSVTGCSTGDGCTISVKRAAGGEDFDGLKVVLKNSANSSKVISVDGNIGELETASINAALISGDAFDSASANKVEVTAFFVDESGQEQICPSTTAYTFSA
jgi:flagellin-like protein